MKKQLLAVALGLALVAPALATDSAYINNTVVSPLTADQIPVIDAISFINNSVFYIGISSGDLSPYTMRNVRNYTNNGTLYSVTGFRFDTHSNGNTSATAPYASSADNFFNSPAGVIGGLSCSVWANNIVNRGQIQVEAGGVMSLTGQNVDLAGSRNSVASSIQGFGGMFDYYWGVGDQGRFNPNNTFPASPQHSITDRTGLVTPRYTMMSTLPAYVGTNSVAVSNMTYQVLYMIPPMDPAISDQVYLLGSPFGDVATVEWTWNRTDSFTGTQSQQLLRFQDEFFSISTNLVLITNGTASANTGRAPTFIPTNMFVSFGVGGFSYGATNTASTAIPVNYTQGNVSNAQYKAYAVTFEPTTTTLEDFGSTYFNIGSLLDLEAANLDISSARFASPNAMVLKATNNFTSNSRTRLQAFATDLNLATTNGLLSVSNVVAATYPCLVGTLYAYSCRWTNVDATGFTNSYHVVLLDSSTLRSATAPVVMDAQLRSTNVTLSDSLNIISNLTIDAENVTLTANGAGAQTPFGALQLASTSAITPDNFPRLRNLTNFGSIYVPSASLQFGAPGSPISSFVNAGQLYGQDYLIYANTVVNSGILYPGSSVYLYPTTVITTTGGGTTVIISSGSTMLGAGSGVISVQANQANFLGGMLGTAAYPALNVNLTASTITMSNTAIYAGGSLTIAADKLLDDGGPASGNFWAVGSGGYWLTAPQPSSGTANLLGTTISNSMPSSGITYSQWAGRDRGRSAQGFVNNAALGKLVLYGGDPDSQFVLQGASSSANALYVDCLELRGTAAALDGTGSLANLALQPGMKLYYARATYVDTNGVVLPMSEELNGVNNGALNWVPGYAGAFSSVTVTNPADGAVYTMNADLRNSTDFNSLKNSPYMVNADLAFPLFVPSSYNFKVASTNAPARSVRLSWQTIGYATNYVFYTSGLQNTNWQLLTNFVSPSVYGPPFTTSVVEPTTRAARLYRVRVDAQLP